MLSDLKYVVCFECISKMKVPHPSHQIHTVPWFLYPHFVKPGMNGFVLEFKGFLLQLTCPSSHPHRPPPGGPPVPPTGFELRLRAAACSQGTIPDVPVVSWDLQCLCRALVLQAEKAAQEGPRGVKSTRRGVESTFGRRQRQGQRQSALRR